MRMLNDKKKKLTPIHQEHQQFQTQLEIKRPVMTGGIICLIGQVTSNLHIHFNFTDQTSGNQIAGTLLFIAMLLTLFVPLIGFGNAVKSAANEHRVEGFVLGDDGNLFKLAESLMLFLVFMLAPVMTILIQWGDL
jgi:stage V sporulation protein AC